MKTWVVHVRESDREWVGNAESASEAVAYARARANLIADSYVVFDWDTNAYVIDVIYRPRES